MKRLALLLLAACIAVPGLAANSRPVKLISYNLRYGEADDGSNSWMLRRQATPQMIRQEAPDVFGLQEALNNQLEYIDTECPQYARVGVGRDDGDKKGETMAIYYLRDRFDLLDSGTLWLSETPDTVSRGWDGDCNRTMTWVKLRDKTSKKEFYYFNTHLDHRGRIAREESVLLIVKQIKQIAGRKTPVVLGGDFNSPVESPIFKPLAKFMSSARRKARKTDNKGTFNGFGSAPDTIVIDHLYFRRLKCQEFSTLDGNYGAPYISDHYPIAMTFKL